MLFATRRRLLSPGVLRASALTAAFSTANTTPAANPTVSYLISRCGFSPEAAARAAPSVRLAFPGGAAKADSVLALLRRYGFSDADISSTIRQIPFLLTADPAKKIQPKLDFLASVGVEAPLLQRLVLLNPPILRRSVHDHLEPLFASLREVLGSDTRVVAALHKMPFAIRCDRHTLFRVIPLLRDVHGLSAADVSKLVAAQPGIILLGPDRINELVEAARKLGFKTSNPMFVHTLSILCKMKVPTLESKIALYQRLGFDKDAITRMIRRYPLSLSISEKKITEMVGFLTDKVGLTRDDIVAYPYMLVRSLETLSRRCAVLATLRRAGKQQMQALPVLLILTEKQFLKVYVQPHVEEIPDVLRAINGEIPFQGCDFLEEKPKLLSKKKMTA